MGEAVPMKHGGPRGILKLTHETPAFRTHPRTQTREETGSKRDERTMTPAIKTVWWVEGSLLPRRPRRRTAPVTTRALRGVFWHVSAG
ncbi:hypothetical protein EMIHUDRAFT_206240 [Emiliania huxleyi CCMP1516]|uniref:Uncharacterized protein n=2 Tax=Emiliania huxleyi TaxID=2903 RepID=A0A0D3JNP0_EMIH1|nr:hypothetical protein EMIHUDRAFT_206240 [Emiliania huxleyi CCMP1516]EOD25125.1 hypothetical protein EMIHUDRAFT_206240 [Emiliania huxleyi CCMP1516]|eukprot:XP_005777554.1 hypothetical protein EMIHUDRAFT_206240 [Emiliania huxleyi CCMP1516]